MGKRKEEILTNTAYIGVSCEVLLALTWVAAHAVQAVSVDTAWVVEALVNVWQGKRWTGGQLVLYTSLLPSTMALLVSHPLKMLKPKSYTFLSFQMCCLFLRRTDFSHQANIQLLILPSNSLHQPHMYWLLKGYKETISIHGYHICFNCYCLMLNPGLVVPLTHSYSPLIITGAPLQWHVKCHCNYGKLSLEKCDKPFRGKRVNKGNTKLSGCGHRRAGSEKRESSDRV